MTETAKEAKSLKVKLETVIDQILKDNDDKYRSKLISFVRGMKFLRTNMPYFYLLQCFSEKKESYVNLVNLGIDYPIHAQRFTNITFKKHGEDLTRLEKTIEAKGCKDVFYFDPQSGNFAIEDPALCFYIWHSNWKKISEEAGFRTENNYEWEFAFSFAGEDREFVERLASALREEDFSVFYDKWSLSAGQDLEKVLPEVYKSKAKCIIPIISSAYINKEWPTFEKEYYKSRIGSSEVIPVFLEPNLIAREIGTKICRIDHAQWHEFTKSSLKGEEYAVHLANLVERIKNSHSSF